MDETEAYRVNVARPRLVLGSTVTAVCNAGEGVGDVVVDGGGLGDVELVAVGMRVGAAGVANLGAARDGDGAGTGLLQCDDAVDSGIVDLVERGALGVVAVRAAAA